MTETRRLSPEDFARSVVAVPPLALDDHGHFATDANRRVLSHIADGGIATVLYGGNANIYHFGAKLFREALEGVFAVCPEEVEILFSIGPDFGKAMDQADELKAAGVGNALLLPMAFPSDGAGVVAGARQLAEKLGFALVLYVKRDAYLAPEALQALIEEGTVSYVKYAVERRDPSEDPYLDAIIDAVGADKVASGMGETPIADHIGRRGMSTFTSGAVCIAPAASNALLSLYRMGRMDEAAELAAPFLEFERRRAELGGTSVLHDSMGIAGIAECGPLTPLVANLDDGARKTLAPVIDRLLDAEGAVRDRKIAV